MPTDTSSFPPCVATSPTSYAAAREIEPALSRLQAIVLKVIENAGRDGLTDHEIRERTGLSESTARARRVELAKLGLIVDSGHTRPTPAGRTATIWASAAADEPYDADGEGCFDANVGGTYSQAKLFDDEADWLAALGY